VLEWVKVAVGGGCVKSVECNQSNATNATFLGLVALLF